MKKDFLVFGVFMQLAKNDIITANEISNIYEISQRSVYRYIDSLCMAGVPVCTKRGRYGGYFLPRGYFLEKGYLRKEDCDFIIDSIEKNKIYSNPTQISRIKHLIGGKH